MRVESLEIVYRVRSASCLYFEGFSSDLQLPMRVTSLTTVNCNGVVYAVPRIPGREWTRILDVDESSDFIPPCDWLEAMRTQRGILELEDLLEMRFLSFIDRITGMPVRCYTVVVKPGVVFEGRLIVRKPCESVEKLEELFTELRDTHVVGGLRLAGCGFVEPVSIRARIGGKLIDVRSGLEVYEKLCKG